MRLKFLEDVAGRLTGHCSLPHTPSGLVEVTEIQPEMNYLQDYLNEYRVEVKIGTMIRIPQSEFKTHELEYRQRAVQYIGRHIYNDVANEVHEALHDLAQEGLYSTPAYDRLEKLLMSLRMEN